LGCRADYAGGSKQWNLGIGNRINSRIINVLGPWCRNEQQQPRPSIQHRLDRSAAQQASYSTQARWYKLGSSFVLFFSEVGTQPGGTKVPMIDVTQHLQTCGRRADGSPLTGKSQLGQASLLAALHPPQLLQPTGRHPVELRVLPLLYCPVPIATLP